MDRINRPVCWNTVCLIGEIVECVRTQSDG